MEHVLKVCHAPTSPSTLSPQAQLKRAFCPLKHNMHVLGSFNVYIHIHHNTIALRTPPTRQAGRQAGGEGAGCWLAGSTQHDPSATTGPPRSVTAPELRQPNSPYLLATAALKTLTSQSLHTSPCPTTQTLFSSSHSCPPPLAF